MGCATTCAIKAVLASSIKNKFHNAFTRFEFTLARLTWNLISFGALCPIGSSLAPHELFMGFATECVGFPSPPSDLTALFLSGFLICNGMHELLLVFVRSSTDAACEPFLAAFELPFELECKGSCQATRNRFGFVGSMDQEFLEYWAINQLLGFLTWVYREVNEESQGLFKVLELVFDPDSICFHGDIGAKAV